MVLNGLPESEVEAGGDLGKKALKAPRRPSVGSSIQTGGYEGRLRSFDGVSLRPSRIPPPRKYAGFRGDLSPGERPTAQ